ncbi:MAG: helix-turn-helix transcriptional regulator [Chthoniobacteraceae bacterium]
MVSPDPELVPLGNRLRDLRRERRWTQEELAEEADVDARHYQDVEAGKVDIGVKYLAKIYRALGRDWNETMGDFGRMKPAERQFASTEA